jgi:capsid assembly protease
MKRYPAILSAFYNTPLLLTPQKAHEIDAVIQRRLIEAPANQPAAYADDTAREPPPVCALYDVAGTRFDLTYQQLAAEQLPAAAAQAQEFVAVLPLFGSIMQHASFETDFSGGTSTEQWQKQLRKLAGMAHVKSIVVETHSPGGQVIGTQETADLVRAVRDSGKRIVAIANSMMASAATWIATAAKEVYVTPGGEVGSIGVLTIHFDYSKWFETAGIKPTILTTSRKKIEGNEYEPLDDEARASIENDLAVIYERFVKAMAANRGVNTKKVESDFGGGGMLFAADAKKAGLVDGVMTMAELLEKEVGRLNKSKAGGKSRNANRLAIAQAKLAD